MTEQAAPAGWYPDPNDPARNLYWDGAQWTTPPEARHAAADPTPRRKIPWLWIGVGAVVIALAIALPLALIGNSGDKITVVGTFTLKSTTSIDSNGVDCQGKGGYSDISQGVQVTITDDNGKVLKAVPLSGGRQEATGVCTFTFKAAISGTSSNYGISVSHRGVVDFSRAQMVLGPALTLGD